MFTNTSRPSAVDVLRPFVIGDTFYADTTTTLAKRAIGSTNDVLIVSGGVPVWSSTVVLTSLSVVDSGFFVVGSADATKRLNFEVDAQTAGDTLTINTGAQTDSRTLTVPVLTGNATLMVLSETQTVTGNKSFTGTVSVIDGSFSIVGSSDSTKTIRFEVDAQTTADDLTINSGAQTDDRTISIPVLIGNDTLAALNVAQTFSQINTFSASQTSFGTTGQTTGATEMRINGGNTNANDGARCTIWNGLTSYIQFGNKSAILGGAYDATPYFYSNGTVEFADSIRMTDAKNIILTTTTGTKIGTATTQKLGFWNATPVVQPTVTGSRGGNAALASLLTALASEGLIVDSTTA